MVNMSAIDLFCGAGGLTHGLVKSGVNVVAGFDIQNECKYAYEFNNQGAKFYGKDVCDVSGKDLELLYPRNHVRLLAGCAPCQPFSKYSQGRDAKDDKKWPLLYQFSRIIDELMPELVTMENVPDVVKHKVYHDFVRSLKRRGYSVWADKVYCPDYGIPQSRTRHVLLASRVGQVEFIQPTHSPKNYRTVRQTIGNALPLSAGEQSQIDPLHMSASLSPINMERIRHSKPGGTWKDWPDHMKADCHRKATGKSYVSVYARMKWDEPSPTITTQCYGFGNGRFGHPEQDRALSLREAAILQTFPKSYRFIPPQEKVQISAVGTMIGNAVPVRLGKIIGRSFLNHLKDFS